MGFTLKRRGDGAWVARADLGRDWTGRRRQRMKVFDASLTEREAMARALEWQGAASSPRSDARLADAIDRFISYADAKGASPNSVSTYRMFAKKVRALAPRLLVADFDALAAEEMEHALLTGATGRRLSRRTVLSFHWFMSSAFNWMVSHGIAESNPMRDVERPRPEGSEAEPLSDEDLQSLMGWALPRVRGERSCPDSDRATAFMVWCALVTGMRESEILALRPRDIRPSMGDVHVGGTIVESGGRAWRKERPKSSSGYRNIALTPADMETMKTYASWAAPRASDPLVPDGGEWMKPSKFRSRFSALRKELGISRGVVFHTLRHTHATIWLMNGGDLKSLQERLGHADFATTARVYGHVVPGRDSQGAEAVSAALAEGTVGRVAGP